MVTGHRAVFTGILGHFFSALMLVRGQVPLDKQGRSRASCSQGGGLIGSKYTCLFTGTVCDDFLRMWKLIVHSMNHTD